MVELTVIGHTLEQEADGSKEYISYHVRCREDDVEWTIQRRYSEFHSLHKQLSKYYSKDELPKFPPKLLFGNMKRENVIKRKSGLELYMRHILSSQHLFDFEDVHLFLETKKHVVKKITQASIGTASSEQDQNGAPVITSERRRALYDYQRQDETELEFKEGDIVIVTQQDDGGWWYGHMESQPFVNGFFPSSYVSKINVEEEKEEEEESIEKEDNNNTSSDPSDARPSLSNALHPEHLLREEEGGKPAKIIYDYVADSEGELTVHEGDKVEVLSQVSGNGWSRVRRLSDGKEGFIPLDFYAYE